MFGARSSAILRMRSKAVLAVVAVLAGVVLISAKVRAIVWGMGQPGTTTRSQGPHSQAKVINAYIYMY